MIGIPDALSSSEDPFRRAHTPFLLIMSPYERRVMSVVLVYSPLVEWVYQIWYSGLISNTTFIGQFAYIPSKLIT